MFALEEHYAMLRQPHTLPEAHRRWENSRAVEARVRRIEEAWALHAASATGFGAAEAAYGDTA
jgi:hypothetical protein